jgi:S1-C subfamily serine protease
MRRAIRTIAILILLVAGIGIRRAVKIPKVTAKAPTTRYHGYELNHAAINKAKSFTVLISAEGFSPKYRGTGILLDETHVLTCAHVSHPEENELWVYIYPGYLVDRAKVLYLDEAKDLALLELQIPVAGGEYATFTTSTYDGEPITIIGNILGGMQWFVSYGIISGRTERDLLTDGLVLGGDSGGPWIDEAGRVVAVSDWGLLTKNGNAMGINGGISAATVRKFFEDAQRILAKRGSK